MALIPKSKIPFSIEHPFRSKRPATDKIIFISCEGSVTEEEYFVCISRLFDELKTKIQFVSVMEDEVHTMPQARTAEQTKKLSKGKPKQLYEKIEQFKIDKKDLYQFDKYPEDEFWIVMDIDQNLEEKNKSDFITTLDQCDEKGYHYAISNPFFEMWLLLHHAEPVDEDKKYAVTMNHSYEPTTYFRDKLRDLGCPLSGAANKNIREEHYTKDKVLVAIERAAKLHTDTSGRYPEYYATTVYELLSVLKQMI